MWRCKTFIFCVWCDCPGSVGRLTLTATHKAAFGSAHVRWQMFRSSHFWFLVIFDDEIMKIQKYYVIFVYILQGQMGKTEKKRKENHATQVTKIPKTKRRKHAMNFVSNSLQITCNTLSWKWPNNQSFLKTTFSSIFWLF